MDSFHFTLVTLIKTRTFISNILPGPREQVNQDTAFLDSSQIYGQNICDGDGLREFSGGRLNLTLPVNPRYTRFHNFAPLSSVCVHWKMIRNYEMGM